MTHGPLSGLRIVEYSAFVAAPLAGMSLAQFGAEVIRIDPPGGNIDFRRMPLSVSGDSINWAWLNKGKKSVVLDLSTQEGQETAQKIVCSPGKKSGILLTNLPERGWMDPERLKALRPDLITVRLTGNHDGSVAMDYTVNCASGFPIATGNTRDPVNHVLPVWNVAVGLYLALAIVAAERVRNETGQGQDINLALSDVMLATVANLGYVGDIQVNGACRDPIGNYLYGAFGHHFSTSDLREIMVVAISPKQWKAICNATQLTDQLAMIGPMLGVDLQTEEGLYEAREAISAVLKPWFIKRTLQEVAEVLDTAGVLWGPYKDFAQLVNQDPRCYIANPMFGEVEQSRIGKILSPRSPLRFSWSGKPKPLLAPELGEHTSEVIANAQTFF